MTIPLSKLQPALLKAKEVATLQDVEVVDTKIENVLNGTLPLDEATIGDTKLLDYIDSNGTSIYSGSDHTSLTTMQDGDLFIEDTYELDSLGNNVPVTKTYRYDVNHWVLISNNATLTALRDLSDGKRTVFTSSNIPVPPYQKGDLWVPNVNVGSKIKVSSRDRGVGESSNINDWSIAATDDTSLDTFVDNEYTPTITDLKTITDSVINYYYIEGNGSSSNPFKNSSIMSSGVTGSISTALNYIKARFSNPTNIGDVVYFLEAEKAYTYTSKGFSEIDDVSVFNALKEAQKASTVATGKVSNFFALEQSNAPSSSTANFWFTNNKLYEHVNGWTVVPSSRFSEGDHLLTQIQVDMGHDYRNYTYINGAWARSSSSNLVEGSGPVNSIMSYVKDPITGAIGGANSRIINTVDSKVDDGVVRATSSFLYNSTININGKYYKSSFGLVSNGSSGNGSNSNPYSSDFKVNATSFTFTDSNYNIKPFRISGGHVYMDNVFIGYNKILDPPAVIEGSGTPSSNAVKGSIYLDNVTGNSYVYNGSYWRKMTKDEDRSSLYLKIRITTNLRYFKNYGDTQGDWASSDGTVEGVVSTLYDLLNSTPKKGDTLEMVFVPNVSDKYNELYTRIWVCTRDGSYTSWSTDTRLRINGDMIVDGSITADKINTTDLRVDGMLTAGGLTKVFIREISTSMPSSGDTGTWSSPVIWKPSNAVEGWVILVIVTLSNDTGTEDLRDLNVHLYDSRGNQIGAQVTTGSYNLAVTVQGVVRPTSDSDWVRLTYSGVHTGGSLYGNISALVLTL